MSVTNKVKALMHLNNKDHAALARLIGMTPSNFNQKLKRESFTESELLQIADAMGAKFKPCAFVFPDGVDV